MAAEEPPVQIPILDTLAEDFSVKLWGFSAIDSYLGRDTLPCVFVETGAGLSDLARLFEGLRFPGFYPADAAAEQRGRVYYFRCLDTEETPPPYDLPPGFELLDFRQDWKSRVFRDPRGIYPRLRLIRKGGLLSGPTEADSAPFWENLNRGTGLYRALTDGALILARYGPDGENHGNSGEAQAVKLMAGLLRGLPGGPPPAEEEQRLLLTGLMVSPRPDLGLELLKAAGFLQEYWPELAVMDEVDHSKEFHPEGNVWKHTLETFRYRKPSARGGTAFDLRLSLGLLLHDAGKALSGSSGSRRFDGHAELGARQARRFLERLGFDSPLIGDIFYLVKNHMLPAALPRLPLTRTEEIMASPLFPTLMELYRCDESSSFKGLDGYYESSAAYQSYLRHRRNPYRSSDGKKIRRGAMIHSAIWQ
jgi:poly(A) polymerase